MLSPVSSDFGKTTASSTSGAKGPNGMGKEDFLKLLVTQLKAQDPLNPQDGTQFVAQRAQFTSLERLVNIEDGLGNVAMAALSTNATMASSLIGKNVRVSGDGVSYDGARPVDLNFELQKDAASVTVKVLDENGKVVETLESGDLKSGSNKMTWTGATHDANGDAGRAAAGKYTFQVTAKDGEGNEIAAKTAAISHVDAVHFSGTGVPELVLSNGQTVAMSDVSEVQAADSDDDAK